MGLTTDRTDPCLQELRPDGQQECYLILPEEERAKGFVRPVRRSYVHVKCGTTTTMGQELAETYARDPKFYGGTYCAGCRTHFPLVTADGPQFLWDGTDEAVGS
jgi:hypothetical protein